MSVSTRRRLALASARLGDIRLLLRIRPFDVSTPEGRSRERYRRALFTTAAMGLSRFLSMGTALISIPLALPYLGSDRYGLWVVISSFAVFVAFADLGIGNGLVNAVAGAHGRDDREAACQYVSSAFFALLGLAAVLAGAFASVYAWVPWARVFNVEATPAAAEAGPAIAVLAACFLLGLPLSVAERTQLGYQDGFINGLWAIAGSAAGLVAVLVAISLKADVRWLVLAIAACPLLALALNAYRLFVWRRPWLRPSLRHVRRAAVVELLRLGLLFFAIQLAVTTAFTSDNIVADQVLGPRAVTAYSIPMRLFGILPVMLMLLFSPLWPAYRDAFVRRDIAWARVTLKRSIATAVAVTVLVAVPLVAVGPTVVDVWSRGVVRPSFLLLIGLAVWSVAVSVGTAISQFLNGANAIRFEAIFATFMALGALLCKVLLAEAIGIPGIVWGTVAAYVVLTLVPYALYVPRILRRVAAQP